MRYLSVAETAKKWNISERSVRNYCANGRVNGAFLTGKTWNILEDAEKNCRSTKKTKLPETLLEILQNVLNVDDVIETANHFRCIDMIIDNARSALSEKFIKELHLILKSGTSDSRLEWFAVGDNKKRPAEVGGVPIAMPEAVAGEMKKTADRIQRKREKELEDILDFHVKFEKIHPFQDGNGHVGRLIMFKECLKYNIVPFVIGDNLKLYYYRGLKEWNNEKGYLTDTCLTAQDRYKEYLNYFRIEYKG